MKKTIWKILLEMEDKIILRYAVCTLSDKLFPSHVLAIPRLVSIVLILDATPIPVCTGISQNLSVLL